jgi:hypothetical protein
MRGAASLAASPGLTFGQLGDMKLVAHIRGFTRGTAWFASCHCPSRPQPAGFEQAALTGAPMAFQVAVIQPLQEVVPPDNAPCPRTS